MLCKNIEFTSQVILLIFEKVKFRPNSKTSKLLLKLYYTLYASKKEWIKRDMSTFLTFKTFYQSQKLLYLVELK